VAAERVLTPAGALYITLALLARDTERTNGAKMKNKRTLPQVVLGTGFSDDVESFYTAGVHDIATTRVLHQWQLWEEEGTEQSKEGVVQGQSANEMELHLRECYRAG